MQPVKVNAATAANNVLRTRIDVVICLAPSGRSWRRASERRMNPFSVNQFSVGDSVDIQRRGRWGGGAPVTARPDRDRVADDRAAHAVIAQVRILECRRGAAIPGELDPY